MSDYEIITQKELDNALNEGKVFTTSRQEAKDLGYPDEKDCGLSKKNNDRQKNADS